MAASSDGLGGRGRKRGGDPGDGVDDGRVDKRPSLLRGGDLLRSRRLAVVIGPKGGVSPSAVASSSSAASAGCCPVLGPTALRAAFQQAMIDGVDVDQCRVLARGEILVPVPSVAARDMLLAVSE